MPASDDIFIRARRMVAADGIAALVTLIGLKGSVPREVGARMAVQRDGGFNGSIGGGRLEMMALEMASRMIAIGRGPARILTQALGPDLGQCCGGQARLLIETLGPEDDAELVRLSDLARGPDVRLSCRIAEEGRVVRALDPDAPAEWREPIGRYLRPLLLLGAGHVGKALVWALAPLPFRIRWVDGRPGIFPERVPDGVVCVHHDALEAEVTEAPPHAAIVIATHDHGLDFAAAAAALRRSDLAYVGLIGSRTKRARFESRMRQAGIPEDAFPRLICPMGVPGIPGKEPAIIAVAVAAQLLMLPPDREIAP